MGWTFEWRTGYMTRREYANQVIREQPASWSRGSTFVRAHSLRGNDLWIVLEQYRKDTGQILNYIMLFRLAKHDGLWGYKDMDEDMGPLFLHCPAQVLEND